MDAQQITSFRLIILGNVDTEDDSVFNITQSRLFAEASAVNPKNLEVIGTFTNGVAQQVAESLGCKYTRFRAHRSKGKAAVNIMHDTMCRYASEANGGAIVLWNGRDDKVEAFIRLVLKYKLNCDVIIKDVT